MLFLKSKIIEISDNHMKAAEFKGLSWLKQCIGHMRTWKTLPSFAHRAGTDMWKFGSWPMDYHKMAPDILERKENSAGIRHITDTCTILNNDRLNYVTHSEASRLNVWSVAERAFESWVKGRWKVRFHMPVFKDQFRGKSITRPGDMNKICTFKRAGKTYAYLSINSKQKKKREENAFVCLELTDK